MRAKDLIATLLMNGIFVTVNQSLDAEMVKDVSAKFGAAATVISYEEELANQSIEEVLEAENTGELEIRAHQSSPSWAMSITQDFAARCDSRD